MLILQSKIRTTITWIKGCPSWSVLIHLPLSLPAPFSFIELLAPHHVVDHGCLELYNSYLMFLSLQADNFVRQTGPQPEVCVILA